ncbi:hypothetical protein [Paraburkholderia caballeronis]|uniref:hypothetical protein n=1 Tax=Paraburkholderia caballeronis TaxID=416943 RepID=UPI001066CD53|nr:hypothetical protein [Paraburkholderia caballeronis]TDV17315.1 hypothetical protein C7406_106243 [Paraburkholderia caballeronis]TDV17700.1 hypothetical protein C7408_104364 [Paraburkholderia caballeronis]TDV27718.1 hypothetical protein C7404_104364 [Paraburkholderia caballeronis]
MKAISLSILSRVFHLMKDGKQRTGSDVARELHIVHTTALHALRVLNEQGEVHIRRYGKNKTGTLAAVWIIGAGENAVRPTPVSKKERRRRARVRVASVEIEMREPFRPFRDPMVVALFGEYHGSAA